MDWPGALPAMPCYLHRPPGQFLPAATSHPGSDRSRVRRSGSPSMLVELFGIAAVTVMVLTYALEGRAAGYVFAFAVACAAASVYAVMIRSWPFAFVEAVWAVVAFRRWQRQRKRPLGA
jgi:hypothetical protein